MANILKKFKNNFEDITEYYNYLVAKTKNHEQVDITNEWLIDNYYLLAEHKNNIYSQKGSLKKNLKTLEENYYFLKAIANKAIERKTGARGLRSIIEDIMTEIMFDIPSNEKIEQCIVTKETVLDNQEPRIIENPNKVKKINRNKPNSNRNNNKKT